MSGTSLRVLASRCLAASRDCVELRAKQEFREIAEELLRHANEADGLMAPMQLWRKLGQPEGDR